MGEKTVGKGGLVLTKEEAVLIIATAIEADLVGTKTVSKVDKTTRWWHVGRKELRMLEKKTNHNCCEYLHCHVNLGSLSVVETYHTRICGWSCVGREGIKA